MITPDDLLDFAAFDLTAFQSEAAIRRAISAAYYAAFHAIAWAGARKFDGSSMLRQRIARSYDHGSVRSMASEMGRYGRDVSADPAFAIVAFHLQTLREARELADYDLLADLKWQEGFDAISRAAEILQSIARLKDDPAFADLVLLPLLRDRKRGG